MVASCADDGSRRLATRSADVSLVCLLISLRINNTHFQIFIRKLGLVVAEVLDRVLDVVALQKERLQPLDFPFVLEVVAGRMLSDGNRVLEVLELLFPRTDVVLGGVLARNAVVVAAVDDTITDLGLERFDVGDFSSSEGLLDDAPEATRIVVLGDTDHHVLVVFVCVAHC